MTSEPGKAVFISYASQDADAAGRLCEALRAADIEVWFDRSELRGGDAWDASIRRQIKTCTLFIAVISRNTQARDEGYFRLEWKLAVDRSHLMSASKAFLLPVAIDDAPEDDDTTPERFREVQWTRLPQGWVPREFVERVRRLLSADPPAGATGRPQPTRATAFGGAGGRWTWLRVALALVAATVFIAVTGYYLTLPSAPASHATPPPAPPAAASPKAIAAGGASIAVLPFVDMSQGHDQEYFSDGLAEELLEELARTSGLRVIARTSSFSFKGKSLDVPTIARQLRVDNVLEGSVRKAGARIRVTTQLVRADTGEHLWSETFDRDARDIFRVQDDIAAAVVRALRLKLAPGDAAQIAGTQSAEAYYALMRASQQVAGRKPDDFRAAIASLNHAIALDPAFALAYARRANAEFSISDETNDSAMRKAAGADANRAIQLDPGLADGYSERAQLRANVDWDWAGALSDVRKAVALKPGSENAQSGYGRLMMLIGRSQEALEHLELATQLDPLSSRSWQNLGLLHLALHDPGSARAAFKRATEVQPDDTFAWFNLGDVELLSGRATDALGDYGRVSLAPLRAVGVAMAEFSLGHSAASQRALDEAIAAGADGLADQIADAFAWRHDTDKAFEWLERAYRQRDGGLVELNVDRFKDPLRKDPRFDALRHKLGLAAESGL